MHASQRRVPTIVHSVSKHTHPQLVLYTPLDDFGNVRGMPTSVCRIPEGMGQACDLVLRGIKFPMYAIASLELNPDRLESFMTNSYCYFHEKNRSPVKLDDDTTGGTEVNRGNFVFEGRSMRARGAYVATVRSVQLHEELNKQVLLITYNNHEVLSYFLQRFTRPLTLDKENMSITVIGSKPPANVKLAVACKDTFADYMHGLDFPFNRHTRCSTTLFSMSSQMCNSGPCLLHVKLQDACNSNYRSTDAVNERLDIPGALWKTANLHGKNEVVCVDMASVKTTFVLGGSLWSGKLRSVFDPSESPPVKRKMKPNPLQGVVPAHKKARLTGPMDTFLQFAAPPPPRRETE